MEEPANPLADSHSILRVKLNDRIEGKPPTLDGIISAVRAELESDGKETREMKMMIDRAEGVRGEFGPWEILLPDDAAATLIEAGSIVVFEVDNGASGTATKE